MLLHRGSVSLLASVCLLATACNSSKKETPTTSPAVADSPAAAATPVADSPAADEQRDCVRPGTYTITSDGPFYVVDFTGELPPPGERKQRLDDVRDCGLHPQLDETFTVAIADGTPTVTFAEDTLGDFTVSKVVASDCRLSFAVENEGEPWMLDRAELVIDFSKGELAGEATNLYFAIKFDGEAGEDMVHCATDETKIEVTAVP